MNGASLVISSAMPPKPHEDDFKCATLLLWLSTISANTNVIWHWNWFCHGKTDECDAGGGAMRRHPLAYVVGDHAAKRRRD